MAQINKINLWLTYSLLGVFLILIILLVSFYVQYQSDQELLVETPVTEQVISETEVSLVNSPDWRAIYPDPKPMQIGKQEVLASVAQTMSERITGLSGTTFLPEELVKLFIFDNPGLHSIWMKDMNYSLDIIWVDEAAKIVHLEEEVSPESYPNFFTSTLPAKYVIEANAGFVAKNEIKIGDIVVLPKL